MFDESNLVCETEQLNVLFTLSQLKHERMQSRFTGTKVIALDKQAIKQINQQKEFLVTKKLDGRRAMLFCDAPNLFLIDTRQNVYKLSEQLESDEAFVFDGEIVDNTFFVFDCFFYNTVLHNMKLSNRLAIGCTILNNNPLPFCKIKQFFRVNDLDGALESYSDLQSDGLIFSSDKNESKDVHYKFKPFSQLTVDFEVRTLAPSQQQVELFIENHVVATSTVPHNQSTNIVEFRPVINGDDIEWRYVRDRTDKTQSNSIGVYTHTMQIIQQNIDMNYLRQTLLLKNNRKTKRKEYVYFNDVSQSIDSITQMRNFHNKIVKDQLFDLMFFSMRSGGNFYRHLELACGRGNDMYRIIKYIEKYIHAEKIYLTFVDKSSKALEECERRFSAYNLVNVFADFIVIDCNDRYKMHLTFQDIQFDSISCQFGAHYFPETLPMIIDDFLAIDGVLVCTCFDKAAILNLLASNKSKEYKDKNNTLCAAVKRGKDFPETIDVYVQSIGKIHTENVVDIPELLTKFKVSSQSFQESTTPLYNEHSVMFDFSCLYSSYFVTKKKNNEYASPNAEDYGPDF